MTLLYNISDREFPTSLGRPREVSGFTEMKQRVEKLIRTPKGGCEIYARSSYGLDFYNKLGVTRNVDVLTADLARELREKLCDGAEILAVKDVKLAVTKHAGTASFTLDTIYGVTKEAIEW